MAKAAAAISRQMALLMVLIMVLRDRGRAPEGSGIQQLHDLLAALSNSPPLIKLLGLHQGISLIVQLN